MAGEGRRSYVILRFDGLILHTKPITFDEARWLFHHAYYVVKDAALKARYLEEWGNALDAYGYLEQADEADINNLYFRITGVYNGFEEFERRAGEMLRRGGLRPRTRQALEELLDRARELLRRPVEPRPLGPVPARYYEMPGPHLVRGPGFLERTVPEAEWFAHEEHQLFHDLYGISVFKDSFWLWGQYEGAGTHAVIVRRDVDEREVIDAALRDDAASEFIRDYASYFRDVINRHKDELINKGYEDVARRARQVLTLAELLGAGRREEGEAVAA